MTHNPFQKGKFYTLPIVDIRKQGVDSFFIIKANDREYAIRMFDFQRDDTSLCIGCDLPCMVKDVHGDVIVFVQNFAQVFKDRYLAGQKYQFIVCNEAYNPDTDNIYYDIRDKDGVPFRLKCSRDTYLIPNQKISCLVSRPSQNKMVLTLDTDRNDTVAKCVTPEELLDSVDVAPAVKHYVLSAFNENEGFDEARQYLDHDNAVWVVKAVMAVEGVEKWPHMSERSERKLLDCYHSVCMYLLEDTDYLLQFGESERENFQEWIADRVAMAETYKECLALKGSGRCAEETDAILAKIGNSGYIFRPHQRMRLLIAIFSMQPELLEEEIDSILNLVDKCAKNWKQPSFTDAFSSFLRFYIASNRERANNIAIVDEEQSRVLLNRMVRSLCYLLLMTEGKGQKTQLYKSMLLHYLSFVRQKSVLNSSDLKKNMAETLVEHAFQTLLLSEDNSMKIAWGQDFSNGELFAYRMANASVGSTALLTRSYEAKNVRFMVSADGITISRSSSGRKERNVLPQDFPGWHNMQIFLDSPSKYSIGRQAKIRQWKTYWNDVEQALFAKPSVLAAKTKFVKLQPEVGTVTYVRVLRKDDSNPYRYYCEIEDPNYEGNGWIDTYQKSGSIGMFHFDPKFSVDSFCDEYGKPMIFKVRINSVVNAEQSLYIFDCMSFIDASIKEMVAYGEKSECLIIHIDERNNVYWGVTSNGYGIFIQITDDNNHYCIGDSVKVRVIDSTKPQSIQGEIDGLAEQGVDVENAAYGVLFDYWESTGGKVYEESEEELEKEAMSVSEDRFDKPSIVQIISILDHKAVLAKDNAVEYAFRAVAHILARMIDDTSMMQYIEQCEQYICLNEDYAINNSVNDEELEKLSAKSDNIVDKYPYVKERLTEMRIVNSLGNSEKNGFLWNIANTYDRDNILSKLARLMLSYNMADGFALHDFQQAIVAKINRLLNVNVELPKIYSFGEEDQQTEFKTSVVFPPNNGMRPDMKLQTYNVMKVICGMVNSYGGTVYLGVFDTGTAKGLDDDMKFFDENRDKFDNYVRNNIRQALGDQVNASIVTERPEAGKHFVYAIKVTPSDKPVMLKLDNKYWLREGTSTYYVELQELQEIMAKRDFSHYDTAAHDLDAVAADSTADNGQADGTLETTATKRVRKTDEDVSIATSHQRSNVTESWNENYMFDTNCFIRLQNIGDWCVLDDVPYEEGILTLAVQNDETDGYLIVAYDNGKVNKVPMAQIIDKARGKINKMYADATPIFMSPAKKDMALLTAYEDEKGKRHYRLDDISQMPDGKMLAEGQTLTDVEFRRMFFCELVDRKCAGDLKRMYNMKRSSLGTQIFADFYKKEHDFIVSKLNIQL